jgi:hypothetical protein
MDIFYSYLCIVEPCITRICVGSCSATSESCSVRKCLLLVRRIDLYCDIISIQYPVDYWHQLSSLTDGRILHLSTSGIVHDLVSTRIESRSEYCRTILRNYIYDRLSALVRGYIYTCLYMSLHVLLSSQLRLYLSLRPESIQIRDNNVCLCGFTTVFQMKSLPVYLHLDPFVYLLIISKTRSSQQYFY